MKKAVHDARQYIDSIKLVRKRLRKLPETFTSEDVRQFIPSKNSSHYFTVRCIKMKLIQHIGKNQQNFKIYKKCNMTRTD